MRREDAATDEDERMPIEIKGLTSNELDAAARLLAARHRADRTHTPALAAGFEDAATVRRLIEEALAQPLACSVLALQDGHVAGFMTGVIALPPPTAWFAPFLPPRSAQIGYAGYAAAGPEAGELYRRMYAALAPDWLARGCFTHFVEVNAEDDVALAAWFSLGFGQVITLAARDTSPVPPDQDGATDGIEVHQAGPEDIEVVLKLNDDLMRHHNASPIFLPYLPETEPAVRQHQADLLADPANAHWIAYRAGEPLGMQTFHPQTFAAMAQPEGSIYLFQGVTTPGSRGGGVGTALLRRSMDWARDAGYERCTLHYFSANIPGARFWQRSGFRPLTQRLVRRVDERIAWAHGPE